MITANRIHQRGIADPLAAQLRNFFNWQTRYEPVVDRVRRRTQANDRFAPFNQQIRRNVISGNKIDSAAEEGLLSRRRTIAEFEIDSQAYLLPDTRFLHDFPNRQVRVRSVKTADLHCLVLGHLYLLAKFS